RGKVRYGIHSRSKCKTKIRHCQSTCKCWCVTCRIARAHVGSCHRYCSNCSDYKEIRSSSCDGKSDKACKHEALLLFRTETIPSILYVRACRCEPVPSCAGSR